MRILQICNKVPFPPKDGGCIAMNNLTNGLINEGNTVKVLAVNTPKHFTEIASLPSAYKASTTIEAVLIDTSVKIIPAFLNLFSSASYNISRFYSKEFENKIVELLKKNEFDIVQLESLYVSMYADVIRKYSKAKIVLRAHNVEHALWERNAALSANPLKKAYLKFLAKRLKKHEASSLHLMDAILPITKEDGSWFKKNNFNGPVEVIPFGIVMTDLKIPKNSASEFFSVFHIGAMDWQPNIEGVNWFIENAWEKVQVKNPGVKLYLAGRGMSKEIQQINKRNIIVVGEVANAHEFMLSKGIMIAPLLSGGGMRIKIIEGMALGKTVVTTTIGAEGIDARNNKNILIADTAEDFANAISKCLNDDLYGRSIGSEASAFVNENYNNEKICHRLNEFYNDLIKR